MDHLRERLNALYPGHADRILDALKPGEEQPPATDWTKEATLYVAYPDSFRIRGRADLRTLMEELPRIRALGFTALHVLPFLKTPGIDGGFDVADYFHVDERFGGDEACDDLLREAERLGIRVFMDFVLNHVSEQHEWFIRAQNGEPAFRNFFISLDQAPYLLERVQNAQHAGATYDFFGNRVHISIIFPDHAGPIPHWRQGNDGRWYYHTFYPQQLDIDWRNPDVFISMTTAMMHWARKGVSFRLDAIGFLGKDVFAGHIHDTPMLHHILIVLRDILARTNPASAFLIESIRNPHQLLTEFYQDRQTELSYDFQGCAELWTSLMLRDHTYIHRSLEHFPEFPSYAAPIRLTRTHDEIFLMQENRFRRRTLNALLQNGVPFSNGNGVAGRLMSFLDRDPRRVALAHFLAAIQPGAFLLFYGDELGKENDIAYMHAQREEKARHTAIPVQPDGRDAGRGHVPEELLNNPDAAWLQERVGRILHGREALGISTRTAHPRKFLPRRIVGLRYTGTDGVHAYANLSEETTSVQTGGEIVECVNGAMLDGARLVLPGYACAFLRGATR